MLGRPPAPVAERFWSKVRIGADDECWEWTAALVTAGYGSFFMGRTVSAHRAAWELTHGPIPEGMSVLHRCDNPICVNPGHLFLGTALENQRDRRAKGRHVVEATV